MEALKSIIYGLKDTLFIIMAWHTTLPKVKINYTIRMQQYFHAMGLFKYPFYQNHRARENNIMVLFPT